MNTLTEEQEKWIQSESLNLYPIELEREMFKRNAEDIHENNRMIFAAGLRHALTTPIGKQREEGEGKFIDRNGVEYKLSIHSDKAVFECISNRLASYFVYHPKNPEIASLQQQIQSLKEQLEPKDKWTLLGLIQDKDQQIESLQQGRREMNLNETVLVKLKEEGYKLLADLHNTYMGTIPNWERREASYYKEKAKDGYTSFQLWDFMRTFGPLLKLGINPPFEINIILPEYLSALPAGKGGWIDCTEQLPGNEEWCNDIVLYYDARNRRCKIGCYDYEFSHWNELPWSAENEESKFEDVTHWQPLPAAPEQKDNDKNVNDGK